MLGLMACVHPVPIPATGDLSPVAFMAGAWVNGESEEWWSAPQGGTMLGHARMMQEGRTWFFEHLLLVVTERGIVYRAQPLGAPAVEFALVESASGRAVFANPRHDFPRRITYQRGEDGTLTATVDDGRGGRSESWVYRRAPAE